MTVETRTHLSLIRWWDVAASGFGLDKRMLHHSPNGAKRGRIEGGIVKGLGMRAGFPDLVLLVARGDKHGLLLEMKSPDGRISPEQKEMMQLHEAQGYAVHVSWNFNEAVGAITRYLKCGNPTLL